MKHPVESGAASQSCSCTSCTYKSESERPSLRKMIKGGSRIDKLYFGKYIPLREQKLLDRLVRTRAVYDDIRTQLLSESDISVKEKPNLKPRKHQARQKKIAATDKSSAILELVDLVDKGKVTGGKNLSDCCSCCSCGSVHTQTREHTAHKRRHRHGLGHAHGGAYSTSRTSMIRKKFGEVRRSVRFKAKSIRSAPCTCTTKISGMLRRRSQEIIKKLRPEGMVEHAALESYEQDVSGKKKKKYIQKTYQKIKKSKTRLIQSMGEGARKVKESKTKIMEHIEAERKKSVEKIKRARHTLQENVRAAVRKSIRKRQPPTEEINFEEFDFHIKKDSIAKFKERLQRKKVYEDYACDPDCIPGECVPDDCFKIIKLRRREKKRRTKEKLEKQVSVMSSASNVAVQAQPQKTVVTTETAQKHKEVVKRKRPSAEQRMTVDVGIRKTGNEARVTVTKNPKVKDTKVPYCACDEVRQVSPKETKSVKSIANSPPVEEPVVTQTQSPKPKKRKQEVKTRPTEKTRPTSGQINIKKPGRGQSAKLDAKLEKSSQTKLQQTKKESQTGNRALKRCFCTLKLKGKGNKSKPTKSTSRSITTETQSITSSRKIDQMDKNVEEHVQTKHRKHHDLHCKECLSDKCDPIDCIRHRKRRALATGVSVQPRQKSVSSLTSKSFSTASMKTSIPNKLDKIEKLSPSSSHELEKIDKNASQRQVVRIGSTFSFSVEFYKDKPKGETLEITHDQAVEDRVRKHNRGSGKKKRLRHRHSQISSSTGKSKYTLTKHSLRRCFCTLKLAHANKKNTKQMKRSQRSAAFLDTPNVTYIATKATNKKFKLSPYECEPGVCVPGECDPYVCEKRINTKQMKHRTVYSYTDNHTTKSISSVTSRSIPNKAKKVQSTTASYQSPSKKDKNEVKTLRRIRTTPSSPERQVVRIGSSFSFNIEFYKDDNNSPPGPIDDVPKKRPSKSSEVPKKQVEVRGYQEKVQKRQKSTSMLVKKSNRSSLIAPAMKRCFCTMKLQKNKKRNINLATTGTETTDKNINYGNAKVYETKGTKTKQLRFGYALEQYECEPNVCVTGDCDPYECLKRIQMRQLKESATLTDKAKMKSATSITNKFKFRSKGALAKSNLKTKKIATNAKNFESKVENIEQLPMRQAVRIGSAFSIDIKFHKDVVSPTTILKKRIRQAKEVKVPKKLKHRGSGSPELTTSQQNTQGGTIKQYHKAAGIRPMLKRCFCTLELQGQQKNKMNIKVPKVITVSRVTVTETKITDNKSLKISPLIHTNQGLNWAAAMYNINSSSTLSKSSIGIQYEGMKSYFHHQKSINSISSNSVLKQGETLKSSHCNMIVPSNFTLPARQYKNNDTNTISENSITRRGQKEILCLPRRKNIRIHGEKNTGCTKSGSCSEPQTYVSEQQQDIKIVGYSQISSPRYYAMNVNVPQKNKNAPRMPVHKLKPYECEPGICIPYECDPYECDKLIKKRLMKRVNRMAGTNVKSKSSFASQSTSHSKTKKLQSRRAPCENVKKVPGGGIKYESAPSRNNKQAVRVVSSFSFNIEFAKEKSTPAKVTPLTHSKPPKSQKPTKPPKRSVKAKGTRGYGVGHHDQDSQSVTVTENKGSGMKPIMQRCFCTLKLQKKGKNQKLKKIKPVQTASDKGTATPPNTMKDFVASRTMMNTGQNTAKPYKLLPYECEPQVCIPGECNPYECLERIKQRNKKLNDSGTAAMRYKTSSSSNTSQRNRTHARYIQSKPHRHRRSRDSTASGPSKDLTHHGKPSRQAVRVGSSFSFNVEFFKENSQTSPSNNPPHPPTTRVIQRESKPSVRHVKPPKQKVKKKKVRVVGLQNENTMKHTQSQIGNVLNQVKSTMTTSFMKRCFCTAKLHGKRKPPKKDQVQPKVTQVRSVDSKASQAKETKSFLKRCFCVLKLKKAEKNPKQKNVQANTNTKVIHEPVLVDKKVVTAPYKNRRRHLEPYECDPGICVPGECNPYECEKLIKARNVKLDTKEAYTGRAKTKSTSSSFKSSKTSKARRTQSNFGSNTSSRRQSTKFIKDTPNHFEAIRTAPNRQVVRIGSNFSFNIEFYKDRSPNTEEVQAAAKAIRPKPESRPKIKTVKTGKEYRKKRQGSDGLSVATVENEAQVDKTNMKDRTAGIAALNRCFCTLKLQKRNMPKQAAMYTTQKTGTRVMKETPTHQTRAIMTTEKKIKLKPYECEPHVCIPYECDAHECEKLIQKRNLKDTTKAVMTTKEKPIGYKLLPYECEPYFCIPGQCDPYECYERIKMRNIKHRNSGTATKKYRGKSVSSDMRSTTFTARKVQSPKVRDRKRSKSVSSKPFRSKKSLDSTRQSVRIGSGFNFDVEFYKNKSLSIPDTERPVKHRARRTKSITSSGQRRLARTRDSNMQYRRPMRDTDSQILAQKMRDTGINPFLKRCFCTLKLQKSEVIASKHAIGRSARDKNVYLATLLPYECEPGICVPGQCDPYECEKRIRRRQMRSQLSGTERSSRDSSTTSAGAKYRAAKNQAIMRAAKAQRQQKTMYAKHKYRETRRPTISSQSSSRQALKIGSSFNFECEFYKDNSAKVDKQPRAYSRPSKQTEHIKTKPIKRHTRSKTITSSEIKRQHNRVQTKGSKTESKSTGFGPLLKRCFCTLALHKPQKTPPPSKSKATYRNDDLSDFYQYSRNVGVGTGKKFQKLKPYECEPNVCIPGQCDPHECYERIKRRLRDTGTETPSPRQKYASSITSRQAKYKSANTQSIRDKPRRESPSMTSTMKERVRKQRAPKYTISSGDSNRQAVKIGSSFSFSVEFFKERPNAVKIPKSVYKMKGLDKYPKRYRTSKTSPSQKNSVTKLSHATRKGYDQQCQADCVKSATRGTTMGAFIKRCFCTLNLYKNQNKADPKLKRVSTVSKTPKIQKPPPVLTRQAVAQTKEKYTASKALPFKLKPYECEPNVCVPGECNPYECLERIKRRNIHRHSRRTGTHRRSSQVSVSSMASRLVPRTSRRVQSGMKRSRQVSHPQQVPRVIEEPRFAHMFESSNKTGVKIGSNVSFNIEFYKDETQDPVDDDRIRTYDNDVSRESKLKRLPRKSMFSESRPRGVHKSIGNRSCDTRTCEAQADSAVMKNKAAGVNNMLKRCFCTLKLQKNPAKVFTVNRVTIEEDYRKGYKRILALRQKYPEPKQSPLPLLAYQNVLKHSTKKNIFVQKQRTHDKQSNFHDSIENLKESKEMKTLYPYTPTKFNKNVSKTILYAKTRNHKMFRGTQTFDQSLDLTTEKIARNIDLSRKNITYQDQAPKRDDLSFHKKSSGKLFLRKLFARLFSRKKSFSNDMDMTKANKDARPFKPDILKLSKSDRRQTLTKPVPKKTTSLKVAKVSDKTRPSKNEINNYLRHKKFSPYQFGDTSQLYSSVNRHGAKTHPKKYVHRHNSNLYKIDTNKKVDVRPPFESEKIVQMALIKHKSKKNNNAMVTTATNTQIKKTRTKNVDTSDNAKTNETLLDKCKCFLQRVVSKKDARIRNKSESLKTGANKQINECPCPRNKKILMASGDNQADEKKNTVKIDNLKKKKANKKRDIAAAPSPQAGDKKHNEKEKGKKWKSKKRGYLNNTPTIQVKEHAGKAAPEITEDLKNNSNKKIKRRSTEISGIDPDKCKHPTPCPCCKKGKRKSQKSAGDTNDNRKSIDDKEIKTLVTDKNRGTGPPIGAKLSIKAKGQADMFAGGTVHRKKEPEPCVCGSKICGKEAKKVDVLKKKKEAEPPKPCICGSEECARVAKGEKKTPVGSILKRIIKHQKVCKCAEDIERQRTLEKHKAQVEKLRRKQELETLKRFQEEDKIRKAHRLKADKLADKQAEKFKDAHSCLLTAESGLDMVKLLGTTTAGVVRGTSRAVLNPRLTYHQLQKLAQNPSRGISTMGDAVHDSGVFSTCRRMRRRCAGMKAMKSVKDRMESNMVTHFLLHATDDDPTKRLTYKRKKQLKRRREPIDFECSLFMASLRRRPCLAVYYTCPWFYPHCLSMLTLWKQFTDVMLFLIAVTVWSPCIVAMEICRAFVCCFFCTG